MRLLITGATGFVGQHLCQLLKAQGHDVYALVRNKQKAKNLVADDHILEVDINLLNQKKNKEELLKKLPQDLDAIIHTAGLVHSFRSQSFFATNTQSTKSFFDVIKNHQSQNQRPLKFIFLSSLAAAGPSLTPPPLHEEIEPRPVSDYGRSKLRAEKQLIEDCQNVSKIKLCILRPPMILGPGDQGVLEIIKMLKSGLVITTGQGGLDKSYSFISVFDLVRICQKLLEQDFLSPITYFTAHPKELSLKELTNAVKEKLNVKKVKQLQIPLWIIAPVARGLSWIDAFWGLNIRLTPDKLNELSPRSWVCDGSKVTQDLAFDYQDDFHTILEKTVQDYQQRGWI